MENETELIGRRISTVFELSPATWRVIVFALHRFTALLCGAALQAKDCYFAFLEAGSKLLSKHQRGVVALGPLLRSNGFRRDSCGFRAIRDESPAWHAGCGEKIRRSNGPFQTG
jgi:hypothetical protein